MIRNRNASGLVKGQQTQYHSHSVILYKYAFPLHFADGAASNRQHVNTKNTAKLDRETEELRHATVPSDTGKLIMQGRQAKGMSQKDLATVSELCVGGGNEGFIGNLGHQDIFLQLALVQIVCPVYKQSSRKVVDNENQFGFNRNYVTDMTIESESLRDVEIM